MVEVEIDSISVKIVILGEPAVGKTTLRQSFMGNRMEKDYQMTLGADIVVASIKVKENISIDAQIWDLAGQETYIPLTRSFVKGAQGAIVVFDLTRDYTFDKISDWLDILHEENPQLDNNIPFIIIGNKADLETRINTNDELVHDFISYVNRHNKYAKTPTEYIKTSAKTGYKVNEAFSRLASIMLENYEKLGQMDILEDAIEKSTSANDQGKDHDVNSQDGYDKTTEQEQSSSSNNTGTKISTSEMGSKEEISVVEESYKSTLKDKDQTRRKNQSEPEMKRSWTDDVDIDITVPNPNDVVNVFIDVGHDLDTQNNEEINLVSQVHSKVPLDTLLTSNYDETGYDLSIYQNAIEVMTIDPQEYFDLYHHQQKVGKWLKIHNYQRFYLAFKFYQKYRDPMIRNKDLTTAESLYESIMNVARKQHMQDNNQSIEIPLSKITIPQNIIIETIYDIPKLEWRRTQEDINLFSNSLITVILSQFKKGWMVNPDLIRLLNLVSEEILLNYLTEESILQQIQIITSIQRLADIMYISNFGILDEISPEIQSNMYNQPLETRSNIPNSETKEVVDFLNRIKSFSNIFRKQAEIARKIGICTKPLNDTIIDFVVINSSSDAIRQLLSIVHIAMDQDEIESQIEIMLNMISDKKFLDVVDYYFDPEFELLHTPLLSALQSTIDRLNIYLETTFFVDSQFDHSDLDKISSILDTIIQKLRTKDYNKDLIQIWTKVNDYLSSMITLDNNRPIEQKYTLIRGKEVILNIMTPLLLAKFEGRGYNPLAATKDNTMKSQLKNRTGVVAIGGKFKTEQLLDLLDTLFIEAPELKKQNNSNKITSKLLITRLPPSIKKNSSSYGSQLIPSKLCTGLTRIANQYITGGGERNLHKALVELIEFTKSH